ncbi:lipopolysaccharide biosynthesis protein [Rhodobacteraceae bacterium (ex Bugula neritina AB1)]|nr:lipopolysaccharide biosynthesis protein [Rhodobacteraceae bacterium (ex Bugula neritina AB1)]
MDLKFYFSLFMRRLHWFMLFLVIGSALGLTLATVLPPVYVAQARLLVESEQIPGDLAESTVRIQAAEQLQIIQQRILTRETLVDMANRLNIYGTRGGAQRPRLTTDELVADMRKRISIIMSGGQQRRGPRLATLVSVSFEAPTARMSASVTNELVTLIQREDVEMRTRVARQTLSFFQQEVDRLDTVLAGQGADILAFKEENQEALPDSLQFRRNQQAAAQERLLQLERQEAGLKDRRSRMESLREQFESQSSAGDLPAQTPEEAQLQELEDQLAAQLSILAPSNPKVKLLEARIEGLRKRVEAQRARRGGVTEEGTPMTNFDLQMEQLDGQIEFIEDQKNQLNDTLATLAASIEATPGNAITLETLERDYANTRVQYDLAVSKRAQAQTGDIIEALRQGQRISVVEQAVVPSEPEKPDRKVIAAAGVGGGMVLGLAVVALLELLKKGIRRPVDLTNRLGITPFATLPYYRTRAELIRRRLIITGVLGFFLIGIPLGLWAVDTYVMPLEQLLDAIMQRVGLAGLLSDAASALV